MGRGPHIHERDYDYGPVARTLKAYRDEHRMTQAEFVDFINAQLELDNVKLKNGSNCRLTVSALSKYETGVSPRKAMLEALCKAMGCSIVKFVAEDVVSNPIENAYTEEKSEISNKTYFSHNQMPVWIEINKDTGAGRYALVNYPDKKFIFANGTHMTFEEVDSNPDYRVLDGPVAFSQSMQNVKSLPLKISEIEGASRVWIEFVGQPEEVRNTCRGWYIYVKDQYFIGEKGIPLPLSGFGRDYFVFADCID